MTIQRWRPDTCECIVDERVNGDAPKTLERVVKKCEAHSEVPDAELYDVLYAAPDGENRRKNEIHAWALEQPDLSEATFDAETQKPVRRLKPGQAFNWRFEGKGKRRVLVVSGLRPSADAQPTSGIRAFGAFSAPEAPVVPLHQRPHPHAGTVRFE